jgi:His/Glu/Gln/Arg/opine family amino acid ABC transporter permease subunit
LEQPVEYDRYVAETQPTTWQGQLARYLRFLPQLGWAAVATLQISILAMLVAVGVGALLALCRVYGGAVLDRLAQVYIEIIRGTPLLIQLLFVYYGLPKIGIQLDAFVAGVLALGLNYAAYEAENYRAGLLAIPRQQMEAAIALNMTERQSLRYVVIPQAARIVVPPTTNDFISLLKDSSLVSVIALVELTKTYELISTTYYDYFGTGLLVGAIYLLLGLPFVRLARWAERHLSRGLTHASR